MLVSSLVGNRLHVSLVMNPTSSMIAPLLTTFCQTSGYLPASET